MDRGCLDLNIFHDLVKKIDHSEQGDSRNILVNFQLVYVLQN